MLLTNMLNYMVRSSSSSGSYAPVPGGPGRPTYEPPHNGAMALNPQRHPHQPSPPPVAAPIAGYSAAPSAPPLPPHYPQQQWQPPAFYPAGAYSPFAAGSDVAVGVPVQSRYPNIPPASDGAPYGQGQQQYIPPPAVEADFGAKKEESSVPPMRKG